MPAVSKIPANLPITITVGADFTLALTVTIGGTPYDFSGATVSAIIYGPSGTALSTAFTTSTASNVLTLSLSDTETTTIGQGVYSYAVNVTKTGSTDPWLAGTLSMVPAGRGGTSSAAATLNVTTAPSVTLTIAGGLTGATGATGATGSAATVAVGTTTTLAAGSSATVVNSGTAGAAVLDFGIPTGATGATGAAGSAATVSVGSVTTGTAGSTAVVTNSGSSSAAVLNFTIPRGDTGATGAAGAAGTNGDWSTAQTVNSQGSAYTLVNSDNGKLVVFTSGSAVNCTIGTAVALSAGQRVDVLQTGAGQITFVASSTTVNGTPGLKLRAQYSAATVLCTASNTYVVLGDLSA